MKNYLPQILWLPEKTDFYHMTKNDECIVREVDILDNCVALRDLVPFVQFKKRGKHPWRTVNFSKVAGLKSVTLLKLTPIHRCFSRFLNNANDTKSRNAPHIFSKTALTFCCYNTAGKLQHRRNFADLPFLKYMLTDKISKLLQRFRATKLR